MPISKFDMETNIIEQLPDDPNDSGGLSADDLKRKFDENAKNIATYIDKTLVVELNSDTPGSSGADNIGYGGSVPLVATVKAAIDKIFDAGSGSIPPDDTITTAKIVDGAVTEEKIASDAVTADKIAQGALVTCLFGYNPKSNSEEILSSGTWAVPEGVTEIDAWLVGGGGAGTQDDEYAGGGGGGGYCEMIKNIAVTPGDSVICTVGAGASTEGGDGGTTSVTIGANSYSTEGGTGASGLDGGNGGNGGGGFKCQGGSGGCFGQSYGYDSGSIYGRGDGGYGAGLFSTINPYTLALYGGGGGGYGAPGGNGGGGAGATSTTGNATNGTTNTGGGGGGAREGAYGTGGSGIIIIYY